MRLLQVCNVGSITGGTAACAWSVTRSLPEWDHEVWFPGPISEETRRAFAPAAVATRSQIKAADTTAFDLVMLHNTSPARVEPLTVPTIAYRHSAAHIADADQVVACSHWLAKRTGNQQVLWQGVPRPLSHEANVRSVRDEIVIGRLCTPREGKWPTSVVDTTNAIARAVPLTQFEFVGCPASRQDALQKAANGRATFHPPAWLARNRMAEWDAMVYTNEHITESFGRTVAEAMRAGCIPVVDRRGGFVEQLDAGGGFLCETIDDVVEAVTNISDPFERLAMSRRAVEVGNDRFSLAAFRARLLKLFQAM